MGGYELWEHIKSQFPEITNDEIATYAGTTGANISRWKSGRRPSFDHVKTLARNIQRRPGYRLAWGLHENYLMRLAGYEIDADPAVVRAAEANKRFMADWAELTGQVAQLEPSRRQEALKAIRKILES